jgi:hypothetical protein
MSANPRAAANASPTNTNHQAPVTRAESSDDVNSSEDSEEEVQPSQQQKQKELEAKLAQEAKVGWVLMMDVGMLIRASLNTPAELVVSKQGGVTQTILSLS